MFDVIVIGGGSAGVRAARLASLAGKKVAIIENSMFGGTCVNVGCIPKKLYVNASLIPHYAHLGIDYGWSHPHAEFSLARLKHAKDTEIARLRSVYVANLTRAGVTIYNGHAKIISSRSHLHQVEIHELDRAKKRYIEGTHVVIATGCVPNMPQIDGVALASSSDDLFALTTLPKRAVVYGGGYIAVECAGILARLGVAVDVVYRGEQLLRGFDKDLVATLQENLTQQGVCIHLQTKVLSITRHADNEQSLCVHTHADKIKSDFVLFALGRTVNLSGLGVSISTQTTPHYTNDDNQNINLAATAHGFVQVDDNYQTSVPGIFALGDVIGGAQLTPLAIAQAMDFVAKNYDFSSPRMPKNIASAVFVHPPLASVGMLESQLQQNNIAYYCYESKFTPLHLSLGQHHTKVHYKLLVSQETNLVVGVHIIGEYAPEILQTFAAAMESGITKTQLDATLAIHPTIAEELVTHYQPSRSWPNDNKIPEIK